jgi:integrase
MKKRHRGANEGCIHQRKDGRWIAVISIDWQEGKRKRKIFYGRTRAEVADKLNRGLQERAQGLPIAAERQKLSAFLDRWLTEAVKPAVRPLTFEQYRQHMRLYLAPALGHIELARLV